jgi:anthranilate/para-aminobenzoate synthase component II
MEKSEESHPWTSGIETLISNLAQEAVKYKTLHEKDAHNANINHNRAMYVALALGPISGVVASIGAVMHPEENKLFPILEICLGFLSGIVIGSIKVAKFQEKSTTHKIASAKYTSMISNIKFQLALPAEFRDDPVEFMKWVENKYDELLLQSPLISEKTNKISCNNDIESGIPDRKSMRFNSTLTKNPATNTSLQYEINRLNKNF